MTVTLNGWQRLWVLVSCLYLVLVIAFVAFEFPQPEQVQALVILKKLTPASQALLVPEDKDRWQNVEDVGADVTMPNGITLSFKKGVSARDMEAVSDEYWTVVT